MAISKNTKICPFCNVEVNKDNFNRHLLKIHNDLDDKEYSDAGLSKPSKSQDRKKLEKDEEIKKSLTKKRKMKKTGTVAVIIVVVVVCILVGAYMYQNMNKSSNSGGGNNSGGTLPVAVMSTSIGVIRIQLDTKNAPNTAANFINLVKTGFYNGVTFHRAEPGFVIQGGGYTPDGQLKNAASIPWEHTGLMNKKWTISMARSQSVDSATSQFFINLADNSFLDAPTGQEQYPYVVFGTVISGFDAVNSIAALPTQAQGQVHIIINQPTINSITIQ